MEETGKKNNLLVVILLILLIASCGFIVYDKFLKKDSNNNSQKNILSNDVALSLIKEKLNEANTLFGSFESSKCDQNVEKVDDFACYYSTLDDFKTKFYSIYSKDLNYKDVFLDYADYENADDMKKQSYASETAYLVKDNKVYVDNECRASGLEYKIIDYKIVNVTEDKIEASIKYVYDGETEHNESMILVREKDGQEASWKIKKAHIFGKCEFMEK